MRFVAIGAATLMAFWCLSILFMRFQLKWLGVKCHSISFNSLYEIRRYFLIPSFNCFFQFSLWDSGNRGKPIALGRSQVHTFNSLYEILEDLHVYEAVAHPIAFNSLYEIHNQVCQWEYCQWFILSILFMRFPNMPRLDMWKLMVIFQFSLWDSEPKFFVHIHSFHFQFSLWDSI